MIPQWVIEYNNANHQSSAGKAIKILMDENERMVELLKEERNKAIDECIALVGNQPTIDASRWPEVKRKLDSLKGKSQ